MPAPRQRHSRRFTRAAAVVAPQVVHAEALEDRRLLSGAPEMVGDNLLGTLGSDPGRQPGAIIAYKGETYFTSSPLGDGSELWKTDGTAAGTTRVRAFGTPVGELRVSGGVLYFGAENNLWRTDGTAEGTALVRADLNATGMTDVNGTLFFSSNDGVHGNELWKTDGTAAGTVMVKEIRPGTLNPFTFPFVAAGSTLFFIANDGTHGTELWRSDGTAEGTALVKDIAAGSANSSLQRLTAAGPTLFFIRGSSELWRSDGTEAGTFNLLTSASTVTALAASGGRLFFGASLAATGQGRELWSSDGTPQNTAPVKDIAAGPGGSDPSNLFDWNGTLYFGAVDAAGSHLFRSDGTPEGTTALPAAGPVTPPGLARAFGAAGGALYFAAPDAANDVELWRTDGTPAGTARVKDINPGPASSTPVRMTGVGSTGVVVFSADDGLHGPELWRSDGTAGGTALLNDLNTAGPEGGVWPENFTTFKGDVYFGTASSPAIPGALIRSDGTPAGTVQLAGGVKPNLYAAIGDTLYFTAGVGTPRPALWRTDGTAAGTALVKEFPRASGSGSIASLFAYGGALYLGAAAPTGGSFLWTSDGTADGTVPLPTSAGGSLYNPGNFTVAGGVLYFAADPGDNSQQLYRTDGTPAGTTSLIRLFTNAATPTVIRNLNGAPVFVRLTGGSDAELWTTDGTAEGTHVLKEIQPGPGSGFLFTGADAAARGKSLVTAGGVAYFFGDDGAGGRGLWRTDGTEGSTQYVGGGGGGAGALSNPYGLTAVGGRVFFIDHPSNADYDLWVSDGTAAGTRVLRRFTSNGNAFLPGIGELVDVAGTAWFVGYNVADNVGTELYRSDGTPEGTVLAADLMPGAATFAPPQSLFAAPGGVLYFSANDGQHGREWWRAPGLPPAVAGAWAGSGAWSPAFREYLQRVGLGDGAAGYVLAPSNGPDETPAPAPRLLPWANLDQISVRFTEAVDVGQADLLIAGTRATGYAVNAFAYDPGTFTATWTLAAPLGADRLRLSLAGVADLAGNPLIDFDRPFDVLPGDGDRSVSVDAGDLVKVRNRGGTSTTSPGMAPNNDYTPFFDVNGSGNIDAADLVLVRNRGGTSLPTAPAAAAAAFDPATFGAERVAAAGLVARLRDEGVLA